MGDKRRCAYAKMGTKPDLQRMGTLRAERGAILGDIAAAPKMAGLAYNVWMWSGQWGGRFCILYWCSWYSMDQTTKQQSDYWKPSLSLSYKVYTTRGPRQGRGKICAI